MTFDEITVFVPCNVVFDEEMVFPASIFNNAVSEPFGFPSPDVTPNATLPKNVALAFEVKFAPLNKLNAPVCVKLADDERLEDMRCNCTECDCNEWHPASPQHCIGNKCECCEHEVEI